MDRCHYIWIFNAILKICFRKLQFFRKLEIGCMQDCCILTLATEGSLCRPPTICITLYSTSSFHIVSRIALVIHESIAVPGSTNWVVATVADCRRWATSARCWKHRKDKTLYSSRRLYVLLMSEWKLALLYSLKRTDMTLPCLDCPRPNSIV